MLLLLNSVFTFLVKIGLYVCNSFQLIYLDSLTAHWASLSSLHNPVAFHKKKKKKKKKNTQYNQGIIRDLSYLAKHGKCDDRGK
jgi:hypothetical protein